MNIYDVTQMMKEIQAMLEDDELDIDEQTMIDTFEAVEGELGGKVDDYCRVINMYRDNEANLSEEKKRIDKRIKRCRDIQMKLKSVLTECLQGAGYKKYNTGLYNVNRFTDKKLDVTGAVPDEYKKIVERKEQDTAKIKEALDNGEVLDFATYRKSCTIQ